MSEQCEAREDSFMLGATVDCVKKRGHYGEHLHVNEPENPSLIVRWFNEKDWTIIGMIRATIFSLVGKRP